jgi:predicted transcriptional regulator
MRSKETSTIVLPKELKRELDKFKEYNRETYANVIQKLVHIAKEDDESNLELSDAVKEKLARAEEDYKKGCFYTTQELKKKLGI